MGSLLEFLIDRRSDLLDLGLQHILVVGASVLSCAVIGISLGVATYRTSRPREIVLAVTSAFLTIP
ncbi:MAG: ABC transporter permease, partial [Lapillicoccus sp.]